VLTVLSANAFFGPNSPFSPESVRQLTQLYNAMLNKGAKSSVEKKRPAAGPEAK